MGKFLVIISFGFALTSHAQGWIQLENFPSTARDDGTSFTIGDNTYCGTGLNGSWSTTHDFFEFNMVTETWSPIASLPENSARQYANGFASANKGYIFGGINAGGYLNDLWTYDPISDLWSALTPMPAAGRSGASCFVIGDTAYIMGGATATSQSLSEFWAYSMTSDTWTEKNSIPDSLWRAASVSYQGKGFLLFGRDKDGVYKNAFYEYTPSTGSWSSLSSFPGVGRTYSALAVLNDQLVSFAGRDSLGNSYNDLWEYSPSSDSWALSFNLPSAQRRGGIGFSSSSGFYYTTGINLNNVRLTETWKFSPVLGLDHLNSEAISIYPNPSQEKLTVRLSLSHEKFAYRITSVWGEIVQSGESNFDEAINIIELATGTYFITIHTESMTSTKKIIVY